MKLAVLAAFSLTSALGQAVITDSGSTNRPGMTVTVGAKGHAMIEDRRGAKSEMHLQSELQKRFLQDLEAAGPLDHLKARHCMKSVSFGSSLFVSYKSFRSPDLSCSGQSDPAVIALQKDADEIMRQAKAKMPSGQLVR